MQLTTADDMRVFRRSSHLIGEISATTPYMSVLRGNRAPGNGALGENWKQA